MTDLIFGATCIRRTPVPKPDPEPSDLENVMYMGGCRYHTLRGNVFRTTAGGKGDTSEVRGREEIIDLYGLDRYQELLSLRSE